MVVGFYAISTREIAIALIYHTKAQIQTEKIHVRFQKQFDFIEPIPDLLLLRHITNDPAVFGVFRYQTHFLPSFQKYRMVLKANLA